MDKAISFKDPLVLAIERGEKTQTRRLVGKQPGPLASFYRFDTLGQAGFTDNTWVPCPYPVGSRLWVKQRLVCSQGHAVYGTNGDTVERDGEHAVWPWKPATLGAMYCPRWASRLTLEVESVRVERLGDITEEDAKAEGVTPCGGRWLVPGTATECRTAREAFEALWDSINGDTPGARFADSPWVWVISWPALAAAPVSA